MEVAVWDLIKWGLWAGFYGGMACIIVAIVARMLGREYAGKLFVSGLMALVVAGFGWTLVMAVAPSPVGVWDWLYLAMAGALLAISSIYFALGKVEEGRRYFLYTFLVVGLMGLTTALTGGGFVDPAGDLRVELGLTTTTIESGKELGLTVTTSGTVTYPVRVTISWGDNTTDTILIGGGDEVTLTHTYTVSDRAAQAFTISVHTRDSAGRAGFNTVTVIVQNPGFCPYPWYLGFLCPLVSGVRWIVPGLDLVKLVSSPEFPISDDDPIYEIYETVLAVSMSALGLYLALGLAFGAFEGRVIEVFKDAVFALVLALILPWVYNASVGIMNWVAFSIVPTVDPLAPAVGVIATGLAIGYFVPAAANLASALIIIMMLLSAVVVIRYVLILTLIAGFPLVTVTSTHPLFRGMFRHVVTLMTGLVIAGPLVAIFLRILTIVTPGGELTLSIAYPVVGVIVPNLLSVFGAGAIGGLGEAVMGGMRRLVGTVGGTAVAGAATGIVVTHGKSVRVPTPALATAVTTAVSPTAGTVVRTLRPVLTPAMIKESLQEARFGKEVSEGIAVATPEMRAFMESVDAEERAVETAAKELGLNAGLVEALPPQHAEAVREGVELGVLATAQQAMQRAYAEAQQALKPPNPRMEAVKAFTRALTAQTWSQLRTNAGALTTQLAHNLAHELGVKVPSPKLRTEVIEKVVEEEPRRGLRRPVQA